MWHNTGIQHNAEWRCCDDLASYVLQLQDSEKVSNNFIIKMTESDISLHAAMCIYIIDFFEKQDDIF